MQKRDLFAISLAIAFGIASGMLSGLYAAKTGCCTIVTADVKRLVEEKRQDLVRKFQEGKGHDSTELEKEYGTFLNNLDLVLDAYLRREKDVLILRKEAVIDGRYKDITPEVRHAVQAAFR